MWLRDPLPIEVSRVAIVPIGGQFWDEVANAPMDISGYSFSMQIALADGMTVIYSPVVTVTDAILGMIDFTIDGASLSSVSGDQDTVNLSYQVKAIDFEGKSIVAIRGPLILTPGI